MGEHKVCRAEHEAGYTTRNHSHEDQQGRAPVPEKCTKRTCANAGSNRKTGDKEGKGTAARGVHLGGRRLTPELSDSDPDRPRHPPRNYFSLRIPGSTFLHEERRHIARLLDNRPRVRSPELGSLESVQIKQGRGVRVDALGEEPWGDVTAENPTEGRGLCERAESLGYLEGPRGVVPTQQTPVSVDVNGSHSGHGIVSAHQDRYTGHIERKARRLVE